MRSTRRRGKQTNEHQHPSSTHAVHQAKVSSATNLLNKDISEGGLIIYDKREKELVSKINFRGQNKKEKYIEMVAYHFEFVFDLCIAACNNVSENPGFETCL
eukprot:796662-Ditylum_brightwellii.AAC.1